MNIVQAEDAHVEDIVRLNNQIHVDTPLFQGSSLLRVFMEHSVYLKEMGIFILRP